MSPISTYAIKYDLTWNRTVAVLIFVVEGANQSPR